MVREYDGVTLRAAGALVRTRQVGRVADAVAGASSRCYNRTVPTSPTLHRRVVLAVAPLALIASPVNADERDWETASDLAVGGLVVWSIGVPLVDGDEQGALQAGLSIAAAQGVTQLLKHMIDAPRPDASNRNSFPSGHTATAFAAATSIVKRRGPDEGVPAMAVAGFTGLARVQGRKHHWRDIAAGAFIGGLSGAVLTHSDPERGLFITAWGDTTGGGFSFAMQF